MSARAAAVAVPVLLLALACPGQVPLECLSCVEDADCAGQGLRCVRGRCEGETACAASPPVLPAPEALPDTALVFEDDFEGPSLLADGGGRWDQLVTSTVQAAGLSQGLSGQAANLASVGLDRVAGPGVKVVKVLDGGAGRYFLRAEVLTSALGSATPGPPLLALAGAGGVPLAQLSAGGSLLTCGAVACTGAGTWTQATWHVVDLVLEGVGTGVGACTLRLDGQERCRVELDGGLPLLAALSLGGGEVPATWLGAVVVDDLVLTRGGPAPGRVALARPADLRPEVCLPVRVELRDTFQGALARAPRPLVLAVDPGPAAAFFEPGCQGAPVDRVGLGPGAAFRELGLVIADGGAAEVWAADTGDDLLPVATWWGP